MTQPAVYGKIICRSGDLAGSKFDLGPVTVIGRDQANHVSVVADAASLAKSYARIVVRDGAFYLESLAPGTSLDGTLITEPVCLDRMHVISLPDQVEFVYTRTAAASAPPPAASAPRAPEPAPRAPEPAPRAPEPPPRAAAPMQEGHTVVDMVGFGALPSLAKRKDTPPPVLNAGETVVDMVGFGALPTLAKPAQPAKPIEPAKPVEAAKPNEPAPLQADPNQGAETVLVAVQKPPRVLELTVNVPGKGPTTFALKPGDNTIGRGEGCEIVIHDPEMWLSRKHAIVRVREDDIELVDLKGKNGTFVQGQSITSVIVEPGSTFALGPHLEFRIQER